MAQTPGRSSAGPPAPGVATPTAPSPTGSDTALAAWAALALSGAALLLGGGGLAVALDARRRAEAAREAAVRPPPAVDDGLSARVRRLEADLREPPAAPPPPPRSVTRPDDFPPRGGLEPPVAKPAPFASRPAASQPRTEAARSGAEGLLAWTAALTADFERLARDPASATADFLARHRPCGAALGPEGAALLDGFEGAKLWAVRAPGESPGEAEVWALTPGEEAVLNWSAHFAPRRTEVAAEVFGPAFDLLADGGGAVRLDAPALLRRDAAGRLSVRRRGRLAGFRS